MYVDLCGNFRIFQMLKEPNTDQYVQYLIDGDRGCFFEIKPGIQGWSIIEVHEVHAQGMCHIAYVPCTSLGSKRMW